MLVKLEKCIFQNKILNSTQKEAEVTETLHPSAAALTPLSWVCPQAAPEMQADGFTKTHFWREGGCLEIISTSATVDGNCSEENKLLERSHCRIEQLCGKGDRSSRQ
jgi:hypothetical protein